jgi:integrase
VASFRKHKTGWRAEAFKAGVRRSKVLPTKAEGRDWAARQEYLIVHAAENRDRTPFGVVLDRYARDVSTAKRGHRWEALRIDLLRRDKLASVAICDLKLAHFADCRDLRLRQVSPGTVRREMTLLSHVLSVARREWGMIAVNPMEGVRHPPEPAARERLPTPEEMERLAHSAGDNLSTATARALWAFRFATETAMRAGEICGLTWDCVDLGRRVVRLVVTKNGTAREVPLRDDLVRHAAAERHDAGAGAHLDQLVESLDADQRHRPGAGDRQASITRRRSSGSDAIAFFDLAMASARQQSVPTNQGAPSRMTARTRCSPV